MKLVQKASKIKKKMLKRFNGSCEVYMADEEPTKELTVICGSSETSRPIETEELFCATDQS